MGLIVAIVNYRSFEYTRHCLLSLREPAIEDRKSTAIVVDNKSPDQSCSLLTSLVASEHWHDWVHIVPAERNGGFAYGNNQAIQYALKNNIPFEYVLLLNPDTVVSPGAIEALLQFMDANPAVGIAGSRLDDEAGQPRVSAFRFPSFIAEFERGVRIGVVSKILARYVVAPKPSPTPCETDWVAGAAMIIRKAVLDQAGLMDEDYFLYFEEVDFCLKAKRHGWSCWYVPGSRIFHHEGKVSQYNYGKPSRIPPYWFESRRRFFRKNHGLFYSILADFAWLCGHAIHRLRMMVQNRPADDPPMLIRDFLRNMSLINWSIHASQGVSRYHRPK